MEALVCRLQGFEQVATQWLFASGSRGKRNAALCFLQQQADASVLSYLLYMLMHEEGFEQYNLLKVIEKVMPELEWEQVSALTVGLQAYRTQVIVGETSSGRWKRTDMLLKQAEGILQAGEEAFHQRNMLQGMGNEFGKKGNADVGARFHKYYTETVSSKIDEATLRDCLDARTYATFDTYSKSLPMATRALKLWTSDACYQRLNKDIITDHSRLRQWMPLIKLIIEGIGATLVSKRLDTVRGSKMTAEQLGTYHVGDSSCLSMFTASSLDESVAKSFQDGPLVKFIIPAGCKYATEISSISDYANEKEVLIAPYTIVQCVSKTDNELVLEVQNISYLDLTAQAA